MLTTPKSILKAKTQAVIPSLIWLPNVDGPQAVCWTSSEKPAIKVSLSSSETTVNWKAVDDWAKKKQILIFKYQRFSLTTNPPFLGIYLRTNAYH